MTRSTRRLIVVVCMLVTAAATASVASPSGGEIRRADRPIAGRYIVGLRGGVGDVAVAAGRVAATHGASVDRVFRHAFRGFSISASAAKAAAIARDARVAFVEEDGVAVADGTATQFNPTWGEDRIDQRDLPLSGTYTYGATGAGVTAYVLDTGIRRTHVEFTGRAVTGFDAITPGGTADDCNGHGTHVAGTIGGLTYGVAKSVALVAVRVLGCSGTGSNSAVIAGIDWVTGNHSAAAPAVANMSLSSGPSTAIDTAVNNSIADGITYAVAAGNNSSANRTVSACVRSPARVPAAITVSGTDINDVRYTGGNVGSCVDVFGPAVNVLSSWRTSDTATASLTGTSMATPHVAGTVALLLETAPATTPAAVSSAITSNATTDHITNAGPSSPNLLLYMGFIGGGGGGNQSPAAVFTQTCTDLSCDFTDQSTDSDGTILSWSWDFGDGGTSTAQHPSYTYSAPGTYTVSLLVTDDGGATGGTSHPVTVSSGGGAYTLGATGYVEAGIRKVDLTWGGATGANVDVYRNGVLRVTTTNDGFHTDSVKVAGTYTYKVCNAGTTVCSNESSVVFS